MGARNEAELRAFLERQLTPLVSYVMDRILELNEDTIRDVVYAMEPWGEEHWYERTGQFQHAWDVDTMTGLKHDIEGTMFYNPFKVPYNASMGQHGSPMGSSPVPNFLNATKTGSASEHLAEIIYEGLSSYVFGAGTWTEKRDAFTALANILGPQKINKWIWEGARAYGIPLKKGSGSMQVEQS